jgi:putative ABC transport system permease protein
LNFDYQINNIIDNNSDKSTTDIITERLNSLDCVDKNFILPEYSLMGFAGDKNIVIDGVDPLKYAELNEYLELKSDKYYKYFKELATSNDNSVIVTEYIAKETHKDIGDILEVEADGKTIPLKIIGKYDGKLFNNGRTIFVKTETVRKEFNIKEATSIYFNITGDEASAEKDFKVFLADLGATYISNEDMMELNNKNNQQVVTLLGVFAVIALIVASIGIFNNITISFQQRRKEFAVMSSIGMNANKCKRLVFVENMYCVIISIALSIPFTILINKLIAKVMITMNLPLPLTFDWSSVPMYSAILAVVIFIASLSTMKNSKRINVVKELKYE